MKLNKKRFIVLSSSILLMLCAFGLTNADGEYIDAKQKLEPIYLNMVNNNDGKVEYIKQTFEDGGFLEWYRDTTNKKDQADLYDKNGVLLSRDITIDDGKKVISIGKDDDGGYSARSWLITDDIAKYNSNVLNKSIIKASFEEDYRVNFNGKWTMSKTLKNGVEKYSSSEGNIFVDETKNMIVKREFIKNGEVYQSIEYDLIDNNRDLFNVDSPIKGINPKASPLKNINIIENDIVPGAQGGLVEESVG